MTRTSEQVLRQQQKMPSGIGALPLRKRLCQHPLLPCRHRLRMSVPHATVI
jgi:hypothetical protein